MMDLLYKLWVLISVVGFYQTAYSQDNNQETNGVVKAKLKTSVVENRIDVAAYGVNTTDVYFSATYLLVSIKKDKNGNTSSNKQEGKVVIGPNKTESLFQFSVNLDENTALKTYLFIRDENNSYLISKDSLQINPKELNQSLPKFVPEDEVELDGMTIDETRTKLGQEFYDHFYMTMLQQNFRFPGNLIVSETAGFGRSTKVTLKYNEEEIYGFMTSPDEELMEAEAQKAIYVLRRIVASKSKVKKY